MKKYITIILVLVSVLMVACGSQEQITIEINSKYDLADVIPHSDGTSIEVVQDETDITKLGTYNVSYNLVKDGRKKANKAKINVTDTQAPVCITMNAKIELNEKNVDLKKFLMVNDNSGEEIVPEFDLSTLNVATEGSYVVNYKAKDSSGNETAGSLDVVVEVPMEEYELAAVNLVNKLKAILKNPNSLQIYSMHVRQFYKGETNYHFCIDYSAQNGFGGTNRSTAYIEIGKKGSLDKYSFDSVIMSMEQKNYKNNSNVLDKEIDVNKILTHLDRS